MDRSCDIASSLAYILGGGLILSDWLSLLDSHAGAFGVLIAVATFFINFIFQMLRLRAALKADSDD